MRVPRGQLLLPGIGQDNLGHELIDKWNGLINDCKLQILALYPFIDPVSVRVVIILFKIF